MTLFYFFFQRGTGAKEGQRSLTFSATWPVLSQIVKCICLWLSNIFVQKLQNVFERWTPRRGKGWLIFSASKPVRSPETHPCVVLPFFLESFWFQRVWGEREIGAKEEQRSLTFSSNRSLSPETSPAAATDPRISKGRQHFPITFTGTCIREAV